MGVDEVSKLWSLPAVKIQLGSKFPTGGWVANSGDWERGDHRETLQQNTLEQEEEGMIEKSKYSSSFHPFQALLSLTWLYSVFCFLLKG